MCSCMSEEREGSPLSPLEGRAGSFFLDRMKASVGDIVKTSKLW